MNPSQGISQDSPPAPAISVCMAVYNAGLFLEETLHSLRNQTFTDFEVIAVNDGSLDASGRILEEFCKLDSRFRVYHNEKNCGLVYTRNRTLELAQAPLVAIADADDFQHPQRLAAQVAFMRENPEVGVLGTAVSFCGDEGLSVPTALTYPEHENIQFSMRFGPCLWNTTTLYHRSLMIEIGGYRYGFDDGAEDYDLWARLLDRTRFANLLEKHVTVRLHPTSVTAQGDKCLRNVLGISSGLLSTYLGWSIDFAERKILHQFLMHEKLEPDHCQQACDLLKSIYAKVKQFEKGMNLQLFTTMIAAAMWSQAKYTTYESRKLSMNMALFSVKLAPSCLRKNEYYSYLARWATPDVLRLKFKQWIRS